MAKWNYWNHILMWLLMYPMKKESENASEIERGESMKQLHARTRTRTRTHFNPSIFHVAFHMPNAHTFMDGCRFNELSPFFIRSLIEVALSRIAFSRIWLFYFLFIFFLFLFFVFWLRQLRPNWKSKVRNHSSSPSTTSSYVMCRASYIFNI